jgi:hypothetical protein
VGARLVDQHPFDIRPQQVAQYPQVQRQIGVHQMSGIGAQPLLTHELPELAQIHHVRPQGFGKGVLRRRTYDVARAFIGLHAVQHRGAQALALAFILDPRGHPHASPLGHVHEIARGQRDVRGETRALRPQRILDDLHQDFIALGDQGPDVFRARRLDPRARVPRIEDVGGVQERGALHADLDEGRLHARQHPRDAAFVDIADQAAPAGALEKQFLQDAVLDHRGARLVGTRID